MQVEIGSANSELVYIIYASPKLIWKFTGFGRPFYKWAKPNFSELNYYVVYNSYSVQLRDEQTCLTEGQTV